ncbi:3'-5' exonuclease [Persicirhabdus sediminis]|uniref:3'-5' exonuclease n=1 Tax=Persicirhabdus sediminis TaxID=454144 RepID=A0A8J7SLF7_9BACT|nr:3'-5' exonuclease [Persicirhabdus sediminis]MBK1791365.1 3'-5' exonuclease [Persicirhabdus sediminis]
MQHTTISQLSFSAIDFESAGASKGKTDQPVQVGMAQWSLSAGHNQPFVSFIKCEQEIKWSAQKVHGITTDDLLDAPAMMMLWPKFKSYLAHQPVVAHGHGTEKRFLHAFPMHGFGPWIDTLQLARAAWPELESHALGDICDHFKLSEKVDQLCPNRQWHDALYDAIASLVILEFLIAEFDLADSELGLLMFPDTRSWHQLRA